MSKMGLNSTPWYQQHAQNVLQGMVHYLEAYPFPTFMILLVVYLMSLVGCAWLLYKAFSFFSGEETGDTSSVRAAQNIAPDSDRKKSR